jgi:hypothetical protein
MGRSRKSKVRNLVQEVKGDYAKSMEAALALANPLDFLTALNNTDDAAAFNINDIAQGRKAREGGTLDLAALEEEVNICALIREVVDDKSLVPRDVKFDDSSLPKAKNIYEWLTLDKFSGGVMTPYLEQMITGIILFSEYCPRCSDVDWLFHTHKVDDSFTLMLEKVSILEDGVCPNCKGRKSNFVSQNEMNFYQELALRCGQRSGKTAMTGGMFFPYQTHKLLKMQNPNAVYGLPQNNMLHMTFCALTYAQAKETLWEFYYGVLVGSTWFKNYHALLRHYEDRYSMSLLKFNDTFIQYRHRSILAYPAGPDKRVLRGKTRAAGGIDEIGWFDNDANSKKVKTSAKEVYIAIERSLLTVRAKANKLMRTGNDDVMHGMYLNVSSPSSQQDKICELTRQAIGSKEIFGSIRPTWEMNPTITKEDLASEFKKSYGDAMRDYGAEPPLSNNPFISNEKQLMDAFEGKKRNSIKYKHAMTTSGKGINRQSMRYAYLTQQRSGLKKPSILSIDAGFTNNSFGCVVSIPYATGVEVKAMVEIMSSPGLPLNYSLIYDEVLTPMIKHWNVKVLLADRWNSIKVLSDAELDHDITAKQYSLKYRDMWMVKTLLEQKEYIFPAPAKKITSVEDILRHDPDAYPACFEYKPIEHFILQLMTVQDTGSQILKGPGLTDDLWRAAALGAWGITSDTFVEELNGPDVTESVVPYAGALGTSRAGIKSAGGGAKLGVLTSSGLALGSMRSVRK